MLQMGIHTLVGVSLGKFFPKNKTMIFGILIGALLPDFDTLAYGYAMLAGIDTNGLRRTFTHSIFTMTGLVFNFYIVSKIRNRRLTFFGIGHWNWDALPCPFRSSTSVPRRNNFLACLWND